MANVNFSQLASASVVDASDQILIRLSNALSGADGFARATTTILEKGFGIYSTVQSNSANWTQTLAFNSSNAQLTISNGNTISLSALSASSGGSLPTGGTTSQILVKNSATNGDASWKNKRITLTLPTISATGTIASNALSADQFVVSLSGIALSATIGAPISAYDAQIIMWNVRYTTNIARVLLASSFRTPITTLNWTISANRMDIMAAKYNALDSKWDIISFAPGYII
jgi:hypothetical protein